MAPLRFFNPRQRLVAYAAAHGLCALCGKPLVPGFHADHIIPAKLAGPTDVLNVQALCPACNARKGAKLDPVLPAMPEPVRPVAAEALPPLPLWTHPLRAWQERGFATWRRLRTEGRRDALVTATPGAGKTSLALRVMHDELSSGRVNRIVIVVPSQCLKRHWAVEAQKFGITLAANWGNDTVLLPRDIYGAVVTYAQVARLPEALRVQCSRNKMMVVLDELHHAADGRAWGQGSREAFEHAEARLCLSGTAWRGDAATIPFVRYDGQGQSIADIDYSYAEALADRMVRDVYFFTHRGQVKWLDGLGEHTVSFDDPLLQEQMARRLRAALDVSGDWLPAVMRRAARALDDVRQTHLRAKGLIVCMDGRHVRAVGEMVARITGERPVVALSDDPDAAQALAAFRTGPARWLVVCRMAGEGYDCPDLRVCVWATNVMTELLFRQITGRTVRMVPGLNYQDAQIYLPADPRLLTMARRLLSERAEALGGPQPDRDTRTPGTRGGAGHSLFVPLESQAAEGAVVSGGATIPPEALQSAEAFKAGKPMLSHLPAHFIASIFRYLEPHQMPDMHLLAAAGDGDAPENGAATGDGIGDQEPASYDDLRAQKRRNCSRLAAIVARASRVPIEVVHRACHQQIGVRQAQASLADLERKEQLLVAQLKNFQATE